MANNAEVPTPEVRVQAVEARLLLLLSAVMAAANDLERQYECPRAAQKIRHVAARLGPICTEAMAEAEGTGFGPTPQKPQWAQTFAVGDERAATVCKKKI